MSKFREDDKVIVSQSCKDERYRGIAGVVLEVRPYSDGLINRVCLDKSVDHACIFWFADDELVLQELSKAEQDVVDVLKAVDF